MMKVRVYLTGDVEAEVSNAITRVTGSVYSHALISFRDSAHELDECYFESIWKNREHDRDPGVRGPIEIQNLYDWWWTPASTRHVFRFDVDMPHAEAERAYAYALECAMSVAYAPLQLVGLLMTLNLPLVVGPREASVDAMTCSEFVARCLSPDIQVRYLRIGQFTYDYVIPAGRDDRLPSLFAGLKLLATVTGSDWFRFPLSVESLPPDSPDPSKAEPEPQEVTHGNG